MAKTGLKDGKTYKILGIEISGTRKDELLTIIRSRIAKKDYKRPYFIITAYSENVMECEKDTELAKVFSKANLIVPDGISILAGREFLKDRNRDFIHDLFLGFKIGMRIIKGEFNDQKIMGVKLSEKLIKLSMTESIRVFLLGGRGGATEKLRKKFGSNIGFYEPEMNLDLSDIKKNQMLLKKVEKFKTDVLLVGLGRFKQEKWIFDNWEKIKAKVVIGVGSSFDELAKVGEWANPVPKWVERLNLKWVYRAWINPAHISRSINALILFSWKLYKS